MFLVNVSKSHPIIKLNMIVIAYITKTKIFRVIFWRIYKIVCYIIFCIIRKIDVQNKKHVSPHLKLYKT